MLASSLLSLPGELRNRIYGLCTPLTGHVEEFNGLRLASKRIQAEYETEAVSAMQKYLEAIKEDWPHLEELRIEPPRIISELADVTVQLPISLYYPLNRNDSFKNWVLDNHGNGKELDPCLAPLFSLHLSSLTITYYDDSNGITRHDHHLVPQGVLLDITNVLVNQPTSPSNAIPRERREYAQRINRKFHLNGGLHVRRLVYKWVRSEHTAEHVRNVEMRNIKFFLREEWWWQGPQAKTLVLNWGRGDDCVYFDIS
jgi:hypothetical protein